MILTITSDFTPFAGQTSLTCTLFSSDDGKLIAKKQVEWTGASREIPVDFPLPLKAKYGSVVVRPLVNSGWTSNQALGEYLANNATHIVGLASSDLALDVVGGKPRDMVYRRFMLPRGPVTIAEDAGETITRHVWDAGILLASTLCSVPLSMVPYELEQFVSQTFTPISTSVYLGNQSSAPAPMNVLELGTGVGILGISIAAQFPHIKVVATDLVDAQSLVEENIRINVSPHSHFKRNMSFRPLDWEQRPFPAWTVDEKFDAIVMADVTYNTSTFMALADTLQHLLRTGSKGARVICCAKRRHDDEEEFWDIVQDRGFVIQKRIVFAVDLEGTFRYTKDGTKKQGEQLIDFISMSL